MPLLEKEWYGVAGFLPGHVLTGKDLERLLDLCDMAHFASFTRDKAISYEQLHKIHPLEKPHGNRGQRWSNYGIFVTRLLRFATAIGVEARVDSPVWRVQQTEETGTKVVFTNPWAAKERVTELLDALAAGDEEEVESLDFGGEEIPEQQLDEIGAAQEIGS